MPGSRRRSAPSPRRWPGAAWRAGERVATWLPKTRMTSLLPLACARAGLVHVPVNPLLKRAQVAHILADSGASLLISGKARLATLGEGDLPAGCAAVGRGGRRRHARRRGTAAAVERRSRRSRRLALHVRARPAGPRA